MQRLPDLNKQTWRQKRSAMIAANMQRLGQAQKRGVPRLPRGPRVSAPTTSLAQPGVRKVQRDTSRQVGALRVPAESVLPTIRIQPSGQCQSTPLSSASSATRRRPGLAAVNKRRLDLSKVPEEYWDLMNATWGRTPAGQGSADARRLRGTPQVPPVAVPPAPSGPGATGESDVSGIVAGAESGMAEGVCGVSDMQPWNPTFASGGHSAAEPPQSDGATAGGDLLGHAGPEAYGSAAPLPSSFGDNVDSLPQYDGGTVPVPPLAGAAECMPAMAMGVVDTATMGGYEQPGGGGGEVGGGVAADDTADGGHGADRLMDLLFNDVQEDAVLGGAAAGEDLEWE